ncbi:MAG: hypothetical protein VX669_12995, partial [Planctomycetota bacterium]|nr:hypothetical protein [Planctomycetota bacterium]
MTRKSNAGWTSRTMNWARGQRGALVAVVAVAGLAGVILAQDAKPVAKAKGEVDAVSQQATSLEAELGKFKDTSSEAAEVMVKLVDLYHQHGRLFGLIRVAQRFVSSHPTDKRHHDVLLKLVDGLDAASRHSDFIASA